jgi:hypothetical protein
MLTILLACLWGGLDELLFADECTCPQVPDGLWTYQELIYGIKPDVIFETGMLLAGERLLSCLAL